MSRFILSIVDTVTGAQAKLRPGGSAEKNLVEQAVNAIVKKGVGVFKTEAQVRKAIQEGLTEAIRSAKSDVEPPK